MAKTILTCSVTGSLTTPAMNAALPTLTNYTSARIAPVSQGMRALVLGSKPSPSRLLACSLEAHAYGNRAPTADTQPATFVTRIAALPSTRTPCNKSASVVFAKACSSACSAA